MWYLALSTFLLQYVFRRSVADTSLFVYHQHGIIIYFIIYVDDIILIGNNSAFLANFVSTLAAKFSLKELGRLGHFLGIEVIPTTFGMFLSQRNYITNILAQFHMERSKPVATPMATNIKLRSLDGKPLSDPSTYRRALGLLQ